MNAWILLQILVNLVLVSAVVALWIRLNRPAKDDPRLSKGLQLLQSKISVLEDLSDRTEVQVQQLTALLENKCRDIQEKILSADQQLHRIDQSMKKSLEVTEIFQDRIPHQEIIERQNTIKYVKAAKMAHEGKSVEEIAQVVDLSLGELEFITKVNKEQLMFAEESLPEWAIPDTSIQENNHEDIFSQQLSRDIPLNVENAFEVPQADHEALKILGEQFKKAQGSLTKIVQTAQVTQNQIGTAPATVAPATTVAVAPSTTQTQTVVQNGKTLQVKPFEFKKIDLNGNLS